MPSHHHLHGPSSVGNAAIEHAESIQLQHVADSLEQDKARVSNFHEQAARYHDRGNAADRELARLRAQAEELSVEASTLSGRIAQEHETKAQLHKVEMGLEKEHKQNTEKLQEFEAAWRGRKGEKERMLAKVAREQRAWNKALIVVEKKAREILKSPVGVEGLRERKVRAWGRREEVVGRVEEIRGELMEVDRAWEVERQRQEQTEQRQGRRGEESGDEEEEDDEEEDDEEGGCGGGGGGGKQYWKELARLQELGRVLREEGAVLDRDIAVARVQLQAARMAEDEEGEGEELLEKGLGGGGGKETRGTGFGGSRRRESDVSSLGSPSVLATQEEGEGGEEGREGGGKEGGEESVQAVEME